MKRKVVNSILIMSAMLTIASVTSIHTFAADPDNTDTITTDSSGAQSTTVKYEQSSTFTVTIPKSIALGTNKSARYEVKAQGDIAGNESILVVPDETVTLSDKDGKDDVDCAVTQKKTKFAYNEISDPNGANTNGEIAGEELTSGDWSGNLNFTITIEADPVRQYGDDIVIQKPSDDLYTEFKVYQDEAVGDYVMGDYYVNQDNVYCKIIGLGDGLYQSNTDLTKITLPNNLTDIYPWVFFGDSNLKVIEYKGTEYTDTNELMYALKANNVSFHISSLYNTGLYPHIFVQEGNKEKCYLCGQEVTFDTSYSSNGAANFHLPTKGHVVIPNYVELGMSSAARITGISSNAFSGYNEITEITLPDIITHIDGGAFQYCENLQAITYKGVRYTDSIALVNALEANGVEIGPVAFREAGQLAIVATNYYNSGKGLDIDYTGDVVVPRFVRDSEGVARETVGIAVTDKSNITSIRLPKSLNVICSDMFEGCTSLQSVVFEEGTKTSIFKDNVSMFSKCPNLKKAVVIVDGKEEPVSKYMSSINSGAFAYSGIESIEFSPNLTIIDDASFSNCKNLKSADMSNTILKTIGYDAFKNNTSLETVSFPNTLTSIAEYAFSGCTSLKTVDLSNTSITSVTPYMFSDCTSLETVILPDTVTSISEYAFSGCTSLKSINIPSGVTSISEGTFKDCTSLTNITIPDTVTSIGAYAFMNDSAITNVKMSSNVKSIGEYAFCGDTSLTSIDLPDCLWRIDAGVFSKCESLNNVHIPNTLTAIKDETFFNCRNLTSIAIPDSVTSIGESAFKQCVSLTNVTIPGSVTKMGDGAFYGCTKLRSVVIEDGLTVLNPAVFLACSSLSSIQLPNTLTEIQLRAFSACESLTELTIPDSVTKLGECAFQSCYALKKVNLSSGIKSIDPNIFLGDENLNVVRYKNVDYTISKDLEDKLQEDGVENYQNVWFYR